MEGETWLCGLFIPKMAFKYYPSPFNSEHFYLEKSLPRGEFLKAAVISSPSFEKSGISLFACVFASTLCMGSALVGEEIRVSQMVFSEHDNEKTWIAAPRELNMIHHKIYMYLLTKVNAVWILSILAQVAFIIDHDNLMVKNGGGG